MQSLLDTASLWCAQNHMRVNIAKCGTFHLEGPLRVGGEAIPVVSSYRYLGVPISARTGAVDVDAHISSLHKRALASLLMLRNDLVSECWPPAVKLAMYKMFVRPRMEYGAPLLAALGCSRRKLRPLADLQCDAVRWITGRPQPKNVLAFMTGLQPIELRFQQLKTMCIGHIHRLPLAHPLNMCGRHKKNSLHAKILKTPYVGELSNSAFRAFYAKRAAPRHTLCRIMSLPNRGNLYTADTALLMDGGCKSAIKWRTNAYHKKHVCLCGVPFTRAHVETCLSIPLGSKKRAAQYKEAAQRLPNVPNFNVLDFLLNQGLTRRFRRMMRVLENLPLNREQNAAPAKQT